MKARGRSSSLTAGGANWDVHINASLVPSILNAKTNTVLDILIKDPHLVQNLTVGNFTQLLRLTEGRYFTAR